jgi:hypothetical protein
MWFPVSSMYGGFGYRLDAAGVEAKLVSESWGEKSGGEKGDIQDIRAERVSWPPCQ